MTLLKRTLFGVFGVMQCVYAVQGKKKKKTLFSHTVHYCCSSQKAFVASSGDIITDYNDLYCLFMRHVASHLASHLNITMSAFVIGETTNNKRYSTLLKTRI